MANSPKQPDVGGSNQVSATHDDRPGVTPGYTQLLVAYTASKDAAFLLPHLRPGMTLLDCGCGYGTITTGLAEVVAPGRVVGLDLDEERIVAARKHAAERGVNNVDFQTANVCQLPFPDDFFDAAFEHHILMYFKDPLIPVKEIRRVLKQGGVFGARDNDWGSGIYANSNPVLEQAMELINSWYIHRGTDMQFARRLRGVLGQAGFCRIEASASCDSCGTPETVRQRAETWARIAQQADFGKFAIESGQADPETLDRMNVALKEWGEHPDSFFAQIKCEAVGWKE